MNIENVVAAVSVPLPRFHAARMPSSVPITIEATVAVPTSQTVGQKESMITSLTGRLLLIEMPRSPCSV